MDLRSCHVYLPCKPTTAPLQWGSIDAEGALTLPCSNVITCDDKVAHQSLQSLLATIVTRLSAQDALSNHIC